MISFRQGGGVCPRLLSDMITWREHPRRHRIARHTHHHLSQSVTISLTVSPSLPTPKLELLRLPRILKTRKIRPIKNDKFDLKLWVNN